MTDGITRRAHELESFGFKGIDALHVAAAEAAQVDYFCTCDDRLLKRARATTSIPLQIVTPLELADEILK